MPTINLTTKTHFDLIEMVSIMKHDYWNFVESYQSQLKDYPNDEYINSDKAKSTYALCLERLEICDRIVKELREDNFDWSAWHYSFRCSKLPKEEKDKNNVTN